MIRSARTRPAARGTAADSSRPDTADDAEAAIATALRILHGGGQTEVTLRRRLEARGFDRRTAQGAAAEAVRLGYVDDAAFARSLVERRTGRGYGLATVRAELRARGVGELRIDDVTAGIGPDAELESATALASRLIAKERSRRNADEERTAQRVAGALARRGFGADTVRSAIRSAWTGPLPDD